MTTRNVTLATGGEARLRNEGARLAAVLVNGGTAKPVPGTWSATSELLAMELAPRHPEIAFAEVRYRIKSWNALESCMADAEAALDLTESTGARRAILVGFSMGGAVSIGVAAHETVTGVLGLAPWIPDALDLHGLAGKRLDVVHGAWDRWLPGVPGVSPASSRRGFERAEALGVEGTYTLLERGSTARPSGGAPGSSCGCRAGAPGSSTSTARSRASRPTRRGVTAYGVLRAVLGPPIRAVWGARAEGARLPAGPLVVVSNHDSLGDPFFLGIAVDRPLRFVAKQELWANRIVGRVLDGLGGIPVRRGRGDLDAMAAASEALRTGAVVAMFPQGTVLGGDRRAVAPRRRAAGARNRGADRPRADRRRRPGAPARDANPAPRPRARRRRRADPCRARSGDDRGGEGADRAGTRGDRVARVGRPSAGTLDSCPDGGGNRQASNHPCALRTRRSARRTSAGSSGCFGPTAPASASSRG